MYEKEITTMFTSLSPSLKYFTNTTTTDHCSSMCKSSIYKSFVKTLSKVLKYFPMVLTYRNPLKIVPTNFFTGAVFLKTKNNPSFSTPLHRYCYD